MIIQFGDVFKYREKEYVFLAKTDEVLYAAQILSKEYTDKLNSLYERKCKHPRHAERIKNHVLYCFVILSTDNFRDRAAHLGLSERPEVDDDILLDIYCRLDQQDLKEIKSEIMREDSTVPIKLKELISDIVI